MGALWGVSVRLHYNLEVTALQSFLLYNIADFCNFGASAVGVEVIMVKLSKKVM